MSVDAVLLDYDGLILDTETVEFESLRYLYAAHGQRLALEEWRATIGNVSPDWVAQLQTRSGSALDHAATSEELTRRQGELLADRPLLAGVAALVDGARAHGVPVGVVSSADAARLLPELGARGLRERLSVVVTRDDVEKVKPSPEPYQQALRRLAADPARSVAFEDSAHGLAAAVAAGMRCVAVPTEHTRRQDFGEACAVVERIDELDLPHLFETGVVRRRVVTDGGDSR